jgi:hypothetical protein
VPPELEACPRTEAVAGHDPRHSRWRKGRTGKQERGVQTPGRQGGKIAYTKSFAKDLKKHAKDKNLLTDKIIQLPVHYL